MGQDERKTLTPELRAFIEEWKPKPGNLIMVLHRVQQTYGYMPREIVLELADLLGVPLAKIYGVITFYNFFKLKQPGRNLIQVCLGTACYLKGGDDIMKALEQAVRCLGCCGLAPVIVINGEVFGKVTKAALPGILDKFRAKH